MRMFAPLLVCAACALAAPSYAGSVTANENPVIKTGADVCVGPMCVGTDRDRYRDRYRHRHDRDHDVDIYRHRDRDDYRYWR
jgi:hypothetical protein